MGLEDWGNTDIALSRIGSTSPKHEKKQGVQVSLLLDSLHMLIPDLVSTLQSLKPRLH